MAISKVAGPVVSTIGKKVLEQLKPDEGAKKAMADLLKNNPGNKSISGEEMAAAIQKGTVDNDNQAAGKEFTQIKQFVEKYPNKLSPEAKKVYEVYKKQVDIAKSNGQTGIDQKSYNKMVRDMGTAAKPQYTDKSAADQLKDLAKNNKEPGSISGKEMTDAIIKGTQDKDNQAAGKEYKDIMKFAKENAQLLSPEAKAALAVYDKAAKAAQAKGQTGIDDASFQRMARDMAKASTVKPQDASMGSALNELASKNTKPGSISAEELAAAVSKGARDLDGQSAGTEYKDLAKFVKENKQLLSPDALKAFGMYEKAAKAAQAKGSTSVGTLEQFDKLVKDMANVGKPPPKREPPTTGPTQPTTPSQPTNPTGPTAPTSPTQPKPGVDASAAKSLDELARANPGPGSISGKEMAAAIKAATEDLDNQAAGQEYRQIAQFVKQNEGKLSPEAKAAFEVYQKAAKAAQGKGETGIPTPIYNKMVKDMEAAGQPKYQDPGMGSELNKLAAANTTPGSITAKQLSEAVSKGARDLDGNSAGKEFEDLAKFVAENKQLLTPDALAAFGMYEKAAMAAREKGSNSVGTLEQFDGLIKQMANAGQPNATTMPVPSPATPAGPTTPTPPGVPQMPQFPGANATPAELAKFLQQVQEFIAKLTGGTTGTSSNQTGTTTPAPGGGGSTGSTGSTTPTPTPTPSQQTAALGTLEDKAIAQLGTLQEPPLPGKDATEQELAKFQRDLGKYNRMFELMSKVISIANDTKKGIQSNIR